MTLPKVFVTRRILEPALNTLAKHADIDLWPDDKPPTPAQLREKSSGVDGLLTNIMDRIDSDLLIDRRRPCAGVFFYSGSNK